MFKYLGTVLAAVVVLSGITTSASAQTLLFEVEAAVVEDTQPYVFQVYGDKEAESFTAYGIQVIAPGGGLEMLDEFESILPANSEADALVVEDVNFDGYADLRLMEYLPGGSAVPYFYWLYQPATGTFARAEEFQALKSPEVDQGNRQLISRQKISSTEYVTEFYDPQGDKLTMIRKEVRNFAPDGSSKVHVFTVKEGTQPQLVETRQMGPDEP